MARLEDTPVEDFLNEERIKHELGLAVPRILGSDLEAFLRGEPPADAGVVWLEYAIQQRRHDLVHRLYDRGVRANASCIKAFFHGVSNGSGKLLLPLIPLLFEEFNINEPIPPKDARLVLRDLDVALHLVPYLGTALFNQINAGEVRLEDCPILSGYGMQFNEPATIYRVLDNIWYIRGEKRRAGARFLISQCPETVPMLKLRGMYWHDFACEEEFPEDHIVRHALVTSTPHLVVNRILNSTVDVYTKVWALNVAGCKAKLRISDEEREDARRISDITQCYTLQYACSL
jgi:hypothetical protein